MTAKKKDRDTFDSKVLPTLQIPSPAKAEDWSVPDTGTHQLIDEDGDTPVNMQALTPGEVAKLTVEADVRQRARVKSTAQDVAAVRETTEATNIGVTTLRMETNHRFDHFEKKFEATDLKVTTVDSKVDVLGGHVLSLVKEVGPLTGQVGELVKAIDRSRQRDDVDFEIKAHVGKVKEITEIKDQGDAKKQKRALFYATWKQAIHVLLAVVSAGAIVLVTHYAEHC